MRGELHYDAVVIGAGTAGLVAGARLAEGGARVCVLAKGVGSTHLAPATIDVLGYAPERVAGAGAALEEIAASRPDHPYALLGVEAVAEAVRWFAEPSSRRSAARLPVRRRSRAQHAAADRGRRAAPVGARARDDGRRRRARRTSACASSGRGRCATSTRRCAPRTSGARESTRARSRSRSRSIARTRTRSGSRGGSTIPAWRAAFAARLALKLQAHERVGLPAMLGLRDPHGAWSDVEQRLGRPAFEIPTLPPSVPGMRLYEILRSTLRRAGGRLVLGAEVVSCERDGSRVASVATRSAGHDARYAAPWFVLAAGGFGSGAIELDSRWATHERVLGLPLRGLPAPDEPRFVGDYLAEQPMARVGVAVDGGIAGRGYGERGGGRRRAAGRGAVARGIGRGDRAGERLARRPVRAVAVRGAGGSGGMSDRTTCSRSSCAGRSTTASSARSARPSARSRT